MARPRPTRPPLPAPGPHSSNRHRALTTTWKDEGEGSLPQQLCLRSCQAPKAPGVCRAGAGDPQLCTCHMTLRTSGRPSLCL